MNKTEISQLLESAAHCLAAAAQLVLLPGQETVARQQVNTGMALTAMAANLAGKGVLNNNE